MRLMSKQDSSERASIQTTPREEAVTLVADEIWHRVFADIPSSVMDCAERIVDALQNKGWHHG